MTDPTHRRTGPRLALACVVLAAATLTGFLVRHHRPAPDGAATVRWSAACHGHGGADLHRLLGGGPTVDEVWAEDHAPTASISAHQQCTVSVGNAFMSVLVRRIDSAADPHPARLTTPARPDQKRFPAGDGGLVGSTRATALVTCRTAGTPSFRAYVDMQVSGPAAHNPDRRHLMENIVRDWATDLEKTKNCGWPADPAPARHPRNDTT